MGSKQKLVRHPMQPVLVAPDGVHRFKANAIVRWLLETGPHDLNEIAVQDFARADEEQFAQLIGYSVAGFCDLPYASKRIGKRALRASRKLAQRKED